MLIRDLVSHDDRAQCVALQELIWGKDFTEKLPATILIVARRLGGVTAGAFDEKGTLLGFVLGITGLSNGKLVHWSDMLAVHPSARGLKLGERLKAYQRDRCREIGIEIINWTFDPLVARNAHLNLSRMGARADEYVISMYGDSTNSLLQGNTPTDRFIVTWSVDESKAAPPVDSLPPDLTLVVDHSGNVGRFTDSPKVGIRIPRDMSEIAARGDGSAHRWRFSTREAFMHYMQSGYLVRGFLVDSDGGTYLLERAE